MSTTDTTIPVCDDNCPFVCDEHGTPTGPVDPHGLLTAHWDDIDPTEPDVENGPCPWEP